jgi:hypothetical protein
MPSPFCDGTGAANNRVATAFGIALRVLQIVSPPPAEWIACV